METLTKIFGPMMAQTGSNANLDSALKPVITAVQWVAAALAMVGIVLITINLIKVGIKMSNADSPETAQKCKKQIVYCIVGLVLLVAAEIAIPFIAEAVKAWASENFVDTALVVKTF